MIVSTDPLKGNNKNSDKNTSFRNSHTVILKMWRRVNIKIKNSTIMAVTVMKSSQKKNLQNERFGCPFLKIRTNI